MSKITGGVFHPLAKVMQSPSVPGRDARRPGRTCAREVASAPLFRLLSGEEINTGIYQEVVSEEKFVFTWEWPTCQNGSRW